MRWLGGVLLALGGLALTQALQAAPADDIKALVEKGDARGAYELGSKYPDQLGNPAFDFYFGVAAIDSGRAGEGVLALERYLLNFPGNVEARLELARGYFILGEDARAREEFEEVSKLKPPAVVQARIDRFMDALRARESRFRTTANLFVEFGLGYDSNANGGVNSAAITLAGAPFTVAEAGVAQSATFTNLAAGGQVTHPIAPGVALFGELSFDTKMHHSDFESQFDLRSIGANGGMTVLQEKNLFRATALYSHLDLDYRQLRDVLGIAGEWQHQYDEFQIVSASLLYADLDYKGDNNARDATLTQLGLGYRRAFVGPWQPLLNVSANLGQEDNRRGRDDFARDIYGVRAALSGSPAPKWSASGGVFYQLSDYKALDLTGSTRKDKYYGVDFSVGYALRKDLSLRGELLLSRNDSNIALYEYDRGVFTVKLRYEFK